jgi:hypothetical protein
MKPDQGGPADPGRWIVLGDFWSFLLKASIGGMVASLLVGALIRAIG